MRCRPKPWFTFGLLLSASFIFLLVGCTALPQITTGTDEPAQSKSTTASSVEQTAPRIPLKVAVAPYLSYAPFYIAVAEGYFEEEGLDVELVRVPRSSEVIATLAQGQLDVAGLPIASALLNAIVRDSGLKIVASKERLVDQDCVYSGLIVRKGIEISDKTTLTPETLKTLRYDVNPASISGYVLDVLLQRYGLTLDDITLVDTGTAAAALEILQQGGLDVAAMTEPFVTEALETGAGSVWLSRGDVTPDDQLAVIAFGPTILKDNPEAGERFMVAYLKAVHRFAEGMTESTLTLLEKELELDRTLLSKMCLPYIPPDGTINEQSIVAFGDWAAAKGLIDAPVTAEAFWEPRFVEYANQFLKDKE